MKTNKFAKYANKDDKTILYKQAVTSGAVAHKSDGTTVLLSKLGLQQVEYIGGLWRVQNTFPHRIQTVRDKEFVLLNKLPHQEKNLFEFYNASSVGCNCYGYYLGNPHGDYIVAKYETDKQTYWSYGKTIEQARAFMGIKLYDDYMDLIHSVACKQKSK